MAAFMLAASVLWLRARTLPAWFNWAAIVVAVLMLTPIAYLMLVLALVWITVVSLWATKGQTAAA
jgi:predicted membrane metal-binding protein